MALARALVATNPEAGVMSLMSTYCHWFNGMAASGVVWEEQVAVEAECWALYAQYKEEAWIRPFDKNFVSFLFFFVNIFVCTNACIKGVVCDVKYKVEDMGVEGMMVSTGNVAMSIAMLLRFSGAL